MNATTKTTRINPGIYDVTHNGKRYELEQDAYGLWVLYDPNVRPGCNRIYMQDFATKRSAIRSIQAEG